MNSVPGFPEFRNDERKSLDELRRMEAAARQFDNPINHPGDTDFQEGVTSHLEAQGEKIIRAVITATLTAPGYPSPRYDFSEVCLQITDQTNPGIGLTPDTIDFRGVSNPPGTFTAQEQNGNCFVPVGAIVNLRLGEDGETWLFSYPPVTPGTSSITITASDSTSFTGSSFTLKGDVSTTIGPDGSITFTAAAGSLTVQEDCCESVSIANVKNLTFCGATVEDGGGGEAIIHTGLTVIGPDNSTFSGIHVLRIGNDLTVSSYGYALEDNFAGTVNTPIESRPMDVGPGWTHLSGDTIKLTGSDAATDANVAGTSFYVADAGTSSGAASITINLQNHSPNPNTSFASAGLLLLHGSGGSTDAIMVSVNGNSALSFPKNVVEIQMVVSGSTTATSSSTFAVPTGVDLQLFAAINDDTITAWSPGNATVTATIPPALLNNTLFGLYNENPDTGSVTTFKGFAVYPAPCTVTIADTDSGSSSFSGARVNLISGKVVAPSTITTILFHSPPDFDTDSYFNDAAPSVVTIPETGYYLVGFQVSWNAAPPSNCQFQISITVNGNFGSYEAFAFGILTVPSPTVRITELVHFTGGDTISFNVYQDSSSSMTMAGDADTNAWITKVGT